ncbi:IS66 family transposase [Rubritalea tangerina]|uniref:IS66 family transposase n=1 Tax=Rubritalea tangerina TaxID=430798 RepID=A0ABW4ZFF7_9BACT
MAEVNKELKKLRELNLQLSRENELLRQKLDVLARKIFGKSSEQLDRNQLQLLLEGANPVGKCESDDLETSDESSPSTRPRKRRKSRKESLPENLPTEEIILIPDEVQKDPSLYREIAEEVSEKLDYDPAQFRRIITRRKKFVKRSASFDDLEQFFIAPLPPSLKERSILTPRLAAEIASNRFCYHLPYYRQEQMFLTRHGVHLARNTMSQWIGDLASQYLTGIYNAMHEKMLSETYLQADETPIEYLEPGHGSTKKGYLWTLSRPDLHADDGRGDIFFQWHASRANDCLLKLLSTREQNFIGVLQCDGYSAYETYQQKADAIDLIGCWAHVRRKFYEARAYKPYISTWIIKQIQNLYAIESKLRKQRASPVERERIRLVESLPIYRRLEKALKMLVTKRKVLPQSNLGKAIHYALGQWDKLERCFFDGRLEIDNNLIENGIRPTKLGAKNWLFMGSHDAAQTNAIWYTLIESARRRKVDPWHYLVWLFTELPKIKVTKDTFAQYTPEAYARLQHHSQRKAS